jgi:CRISPR-associated protein Cas5d
MSQLSPSVVKEARKISQTFQLLVYGMFACWTRPENRVERVSYEVPTPGALRGLLSAIMWRPGMLWRTLRVEVLNPIQNINLRTNEVKEIAHVVGNGVTPEPLDITKYRTQRLTVALYNVAYVITARFELGPECGVDDSVEKFEMMFKRYVERGHCFHTPYLGMSEFQANVEPAPSTYETIKVTKDLGWMFYDWAYPGAWWTGLRNTVQRPVVFQASLQNGVMHVPSWEDASRPMRDWEAAS